MPVLQRLIDGYAAIHGDEAAARRYCGDYVLVQTATGRLFRHRRTAPLSPFFSAVRLPDAAVYDAEGFLLPRYWSLPRTDLAHGI